MSARRGDGLTHPVAVASIALLVLNDHVLKDLTPGLLTGKLSDVAGMIFFPLLLQGLVELAVRREPFQPSRRVLVGAAVLTGLVFSAINVSAAAGSVWQWALGALQLPVRWVASGGEAVWMPVRHTVDPSDCLTSPFVLVAVWIGWART